MKELKNLARFVEQFKWEHADAAVQEAAKECVLDALGFSLGAADDSMFLNIKKIYQGYEAETIKAVEAVPTSGNMPLQKIIGKGSIVWGSGDLVSLRTAVFLNAMMGHILELDDVHTKSKTHIATVVIPAAWCLADYLGKSGKDMLEAVICGYEVMARIGMGFGVSSHRNKGWHATGTAGTFGAAAACAKLLNFDAEQITAAFGLAGTQSCSTWAFLADGATNKVLHPARAAANGLEACMLVSGGMKGSSRILDAPDGGIFPMMSDEYDYTLVSSGLGTEFAITDMDKKPYPCCRSTHCAIDAAIKLRESCSINPEAIKNVRVDTYLVGLKQCGLTESSLNPILPTEAKFSTPYTVSCALINGTVNLIDFQPERIASGKVRSLLKRVHVAEDESFTKRYPQHWGCRLNIIMEDGSVYEKEVTDASGSAASPLTREQILSKARACCFKYNQRWIDHILEAAMELDRLEKLPSLKTS